MKLIVGWQQAGTGYPAVQAMVVDELARRFRIARQDYRYDAVGERVQGGGTTGKTMTL